MKLCVLVLIAAALLSADLFAKPEGFYLERLPRGKNVTLPLPATVYVLLKNRVTLTPTDKLQSVKFTPINVTKGRAQPIRIAIYDSQADRVKYADVKPGLPFLYNFKGLDKISVVPDKIGKRMNRNMRLRIESNKPLEISR